MSDKGEKHHYIPKFYLKRWAAADGRVTEFSRPYMRVEPKFVHPDGTGYLRGLYAIPGMAPEMTNIVEQKFMKVTDNMASLTLDALISGVAFRKPFEMRAYWARFVFSLLLRFPEAQSAIKMDLIANVKNNLRAETEQPSDEFDKIQNTNDLERATAKIFVDLVENARFTRKLISMDWEVIDCDKSRNTLLTSDRPIINTGNGFGFKEPNLAIPIGPRQLFVAADSQNVFRSLQSRSQDDLVARSNELMGRQAVKYVWGSDASQLRFVENRLTKARTTPFAFDPLASAA